MRVDKKKLEELNKQYNKLKKDEKIISIIDVREKIDEIIVKVEDLEDRISEQMDAIEIVNECDDESCSCDDVVEQSELYELYSELENRVLSKDFYRALRTIS